MVSNPRILLCGDFDLPSITWLDGMEVSLTPVQLTVMKLISYFWILSMNFAWSN